MPLRELEAGVKTAELCRLHDISGATFYNWKAKYSGMTNSEVARLLTLEDEICRLEKLWRNRYSTATVSGEAGRGRVRCPAARQVARYSSIRFRDSLSASEKEPNKCAPRTRHSPSPPKGLVFREFSTLLVDGDVF